MFHVLPFMVILRQIINIDEILVTVFQSTFFLRIVHQNIVLSYFILNQVILIGILADYTYSFYLLLQINVQFQCMEMNCV